MSGGFPKLGDYFSVRKEPGAPGLPTLSVTMNDGLVNREDLNRKTETNLTPEQHLRVYKGDIAYNMMRMWQGAFGRSEADGVVSPAYVVVTPKKEMDSRFAAHWFKSARMIYLFWAYSYGLTHDRLRLYADDFCQIPAEPPPLDEQLKIAAVLDAWDRTIATIEALIAAKRRLLEDVRKTLLRDIAAPEVPLSEIAKVMTGIPAPQSPADFSAEGVRFLRVSHLAGLMGDEEETFEFLNPNSKVAKSAHLFSTGTIIFAKSGMSATLPRVARTSSEAVLVSHLGAIMAKKRSLQSYLYHWLKEHPPASLIQGDGFPSIRISEVAEIDVPAASEEEAVAIGAALDALEFEVALEIRRLGDIRRQKLGLMQNLLTEERWVPGTAPLMNAKKRSHAI